MHSPHTPLLLNLVGRELKVDILASELLVDGGKGVDLVLKGGGILGVKEDLDDLGAIGLDAGALADDLSGVDNVLEGGVVHGSQGAGPGAHLLLAGAAGGLGHDAALGDKEDVTVGELLLELTGQTGVDTLGLLEDRHGNEDHDGLATSGNVQLLGSGDLDGTEVLLELGRGLLQVKDSLGDLELELISGGCASWLNDLDRGHVIGGRRRGE